MGKKTAKTSLKIAEPTERASPKRAQKLTADEPAKKLSAIHAAARVLEESADPMTCPELIETMAAKGYWSSLNGQSPAATLHAAIAREIKVKEGSSRFVKAERGKFARAEAS